MDKYVHVTRKMKTEAVDIFAQRLKNPLKDKNCRPFKFMGDNRANVFENSQRNNNCFQEPLAISSVHPRPFSERP